MINRNSFRIPFSLVLICGLSLGTISATTDIFEIDEGKFESYTPAPTRSGGAAANGLGDRTGGPLSGGTCSNCHSGGSYNTSLTIEVKDAGGSVVTQYTPGASYTIEYTVNTSSGTPGAYGLQSVPLTTTNVMAGSFGSILSPNSQITPLGQIDYFEQLGGQTAGFFEVAWTAPSAGTGNVTIYGIGLAVNGTGGTSGDQASIPTSLTIPESVATTIDYPGTPFCSDEAAQLPVLTGQSGGTYSSTAGLDLNPTSGEIDVQNSTPGGYVVTYDYGTGTTTANVQINETYDVNISETICENGTFTFDGQVLDSSDAGMNMATFQTINGCDSVVTLNLSVEAIDEQVILNGGVLTSSQSGAAYQWVDCDNGNNPIAGETQQSFTPSVAGNYAVEVTAGNCTELSACEFVDPFAGVSETNLVLIEAYPNPTSSVLHIKTESVIDALHVLDYSGRIILSPKSTNKSIDVSSLVIGNYLLVVDISGVEHVVKFSVK